MTITAEGANPVTLPVSGAMIGEDDFFEGFELPSGASENTYVPDGWIFGDRWRCSYLNTAPDDKYVLDHSSAETAITHSQSPRALTSAREGHSCSRPARNQHIHAWK